MDACPQPSSAVVPLTETKLALVPATVVGQPVFVDVDE